VRNSTEANIQIECRNLQPETQFRIVKKFETSLSNTNPIQILLSRIYKIQIHHKAENPPD